MSIALQPNFDPSLSAEEALLLLDRAEAQGEAPPVHPAPAAVPPAAPAPAPDGAALRLRLEEDLRALVLSVLKIDAADFSPTRPLMDYGLDSIASTEIGNIFSERFGIVVPPTVFFEFQDLRRFGDYLVVNHEPELLAIYAAASATPQTPPQTPPPPPPPPQMPSRPDDGESGLEALWRRSERRDPAPAAASELPEPGRDLLDAMQAHVDAARVVTIPRNGGPALECAVYGEGPPLLLLGGLVMHYGVMWRLQLEQLGARHRLIMFHMPGCGGADASADLSLDSLTHDVAAVLDHLGVTGAVPVVGYSFGGVLAQAFCIAYPERCSALAITVSTSVPDGATDFRLLMGELQRSPRFMEMNRGWSIPSLPLYQRVIESADLLPHLDRIRVPALVVAGGEDRYMRPEHSRAIAGRVPGARLVEFADAGHLLGFTHHDAYNRLLLDFLDEVVAPLPAPAGERLPSAFLPATDGSLRALAEYVADGEQGHCAILSAPAAHTAFLLNRLCNAGKREEAVYNSFFLTSLEEAFDAALRLSRHRARNRTPAGSGTILVLDPGNRWADYVDPLGRGPDDALVPGIRVLPDADRAEALMRGAGPGEFAAAAIVAACGMPAAEVDRFFAAARAAGLPGILVDREDPESGAAGWIIRDLAEHPDVVVFGTALSGFQVPVAACLVNAAAGNPWAMTPNESYVRHVMTNFGVTLRLACEHLINLLGNTLSAADRGELRRIETEPEAAWEAHLRYGNPGYARVARQHGFDARFHGARGVRSQVTEDGRTSRGIVDCFVNVGTCPRGLNPPDVIDGVAHAHDPAHDYWGELARLLCGRTGFARAVPASSNVTAVEAALTLGMLAAPERRKLLCFTGGLGFTLLTAASSFDTVFDIFRKPFLPVYRHTVFIDPTAPDAAQHLEAELCSGEIAMVWFETIQVDANASRPLPPHLIALVNRHRGRGGYLVGVDETQTNLVTGRLLHGERLVPAPDLVALGTALCDSLVPMGVVLATDAVVERARRSNPRRVQDLETHGVNQLCAQIALHSLRDIEARRLMDRARETGAYFKQALEAVAREFPLVREVRGEGLLLTIELDLTGRDPFVERSFGYLLWGSMLRDREFGVAAAVCPIHNNCLRFLPPLTIARDEVDLIVANLRRALRSGVDGVLRDCAAYNLRRGNRRMADYLSGLTDSHPKGKSMSTITSDSRAAAGIRPLDGRPGAPRVCVIGAGVGGLATARALKEKGIPFDCFDKRDRIGGIWAFDGKGEHTSVWYNMNMNTPRGLYQFKGFPMPASYPDFPSHRQVHAYLDSFVDYFGLRDDIHLNCGVERTERLPNGTWRVTLAGGEVRDYDALVVANGHHNTPNYPNYSGRDTFAGEAIHSKHYRYRHGYRDKRVLVVGVGNSGSQIAVDVSHDAAMTYISLRRGVYVLPHYLFGIRMDKVMWKLNSWWVKKMLPHPLFGLMFTGLYKLLIAKNRQMGMPKPDHLMMASLPTLSEGFANRIGDGKLKIVPEVRRIDGKTVHLADGTSIEVDSIIYSTGYHTDFPFIDPSFLKVEDNRIPLFKRIFMPDVPNVAFVGVFQAVTWGFLDMMEKQAEMVADYFCGTYRLPPPDEQRADIAREARIIRREFLSTLRNNYEMHGPTYMHDLDVERRKGARRAQAAAFARPFEARVAAMQDSVPAAGKAVHAEAAD